MTLESTVICTCDSLNKIDETQNTGYEVPLVRPGGQLRSPPDRGTDRREGGDRQRRPANLGRPPSLGAPTPLKFRRAQASGVRRTSSARAAASPCSSCRCLPALLRCGRARGEADQSPLPGCGGEFAVEEPGDAKGVVGAQFLGQQRVGKGLVADRPEPAFDRQGSDTRRGG